MLRTLQEFAGVLIILGLCLYGLPLVVSLFN